jgi:hypothetical protein
MKPPRGEPRDILAKANRAPKGKLMRYMQIAVACTILSLQDLNGGGMAVAAEEPGLKGGIVVHLDRPSHCRADARLGDPPWQSVHNTGFRIVVSD